MPRKLTDIAIRYQVLLERVKSGEVRNMGATFNKLSAATTRVLTELQGDIGQATKKELTTLLGQLREANTTLLDEATQDMYGRLDELAGHAAEFEAASISSFSHKLKLAVPTQERAFQQARAQPLSATGQLLESFVDDWTAGEVARINNLVRKGWGEGWTNQQLISALRGTKALNYRDGVIETTRRNAEAIIRTSVQHVASTARMSTWEANSDIVSGYRYVATLDSKTTAICRSLDGQVFKVGEGPIPPVHINCRSTTVAVLDPDLGLDFLDQGATRASIDGPVEADLSYYDWLKDQSADFQKEALGATRAKLFQDGGLSADKFAALNLGRNFQPMTLAEMRTVAPSVFAKAGIPQTKVKPIK